MKKSILAATILMFCVFNHPATAGEPINYFEIKETLKSYNASKSGKTSAQKKQIDKQKREYIDSLIGQQVEWQGWIDNVKSYDSWTGETGHYKILIDMDDPSTFFSIWDIEMTTKDSSAMNLEKDMAVTFNGTIKDISSLGKIEMDVNVLKASHEKIDPKAVSKAEEQKQQNNEVRKKEIEERRKQAQNIENQNGHAHVACKNAVKSMLKSPSTAKFPWMGWEYNVLPDGKTATIQSYVDSENVMGGTVRTKFICTAQYLGQDRWSVRDVKTY